MKRPRKFNGKAQAEFLRVLQETGDVSQAASSADVSKQTCYNLAHADADFALRWEQAIADAYRTEVARRAIVGDEETVYQGGKKVGTRKRKSDLLLMFGTKKYDPSFRDNPAAFINVNQQVNEPLREMNTVEMGRRILHIASMRMEAALLENPDLSLANTELLRRRFINEALRDMGSDTQIPIEQPALESKADVVPIESQEPKALLTSKEQPEQGTEQNDKPTRMTARELQLERNAIYGTKEEQGL